MTVTLVWRVTLVCSERLTKPGAAGIRQLTKLNRGPRGLMWAARPSWSPRQTRVTVIHTSAPSPISLRGAATEAFASGTERELTGSAY